MSFKQGDILTHQTKEENYLMHDDFINSIKWPITVSNVEPSQYKYHGNQFVYGVDTENKPTGGLYASALKYY